MWTSQGKLSSLSRITLYQDQLNLAHSRLSTPLSVLESATTFVSQSTLSCSHTRRRLMCSLSQLISLCQLESFTGILSQKLVLLTAKHLWQWMHVLVMWVRLKMESSNPGVTQELSPHGARSSKRPRSTSASWCKRLICQRSKDAAIVCCTASNAVTTSTSLTRICQSEKREILSDTMKTIFVQAGNW